MKTKQIGASANGIFLKPENIGTARLKRKNVDNVSYQPTIMQKYHAKAEKKPAEMTKSDSTILDWIMDGLMGAGILGFGIVLYIVLWAVMGV